MKKKILITDKLIYNFKKIFNKNFSVDFLPEIKNNIKYSRYEAIVVTGGFNTSKFFLKKFTVLCILWHRHSCVHSKTLKRKKYGTKKQKIH